MQIYLVIFLTLVAAVVASLAQLVYKHSLREKVSGWRGLVKAARRTPLLLGVVLYLVALGVYLVALGDAPLSIVYPTFASTFIFIAIISAVWFKERINAKRALGLLVVFLGIVLIAMSYGA
ncbi:MAG: EamA family transporter [Candidatus Micrarchaeota archaeon]|nr:EamA family transporter [Candidatus Micrarchaeota archaeon]